MINGVKIQALSNPRHDSKVNAFPAVAPWLEHARISILLASYRVSAVNKMYGRLSTLQWTGVRRWAEREVSTGGCNGGWEGSRPRWLITGVVREDGMRAVNGVVNSG